MERRRMVRRVPSAGEPLSRARLRIGRELAVLDVSNNGILVESVTRLLPGTHVDVHIVTRDGRVLVRSHVVRAFVTEVTADVVRYRVALAFDRVIDSSAVGYAIPTTHAPIAEERGSDYPSPSSHVTTHFEDRLPV